MPENPKNYASCETQTPPCTTRVHILRRKWKQLVFIKTRSADETISTRQVLKKGGHNYSSMLGELG